MIHVKSSDVTWLEEKGYSKKVLLNASDLGREGMQVQQVRIKAGEFAANHYHKKQTEIFCFLNANGYFKVNGEVIRPSVGDVIVVKPFDRHAVVNDTSEDFLYMAFKYDFGADDLFWEE